MNQSILSFQGVSMDFDAGEGRTRSVLREVGFDLAPGQAVALIGRSGSGKSTLLHLAAGIMVPTRGSIRLNGEDLGGLDEQHRTILRRESVGQVFQFFHLLPHLSVAENVALPGWIAGQPSAETRERSSSLLDRVGLLDRADDAVGRLSGGEMQRVAICRALLRRPALVLADEPTGSLDDATGRQVMSLLLDLVRAEGGALLYATHSRDLASRANAVWHLTDGELACPHAGTTS